MSKPDKDRKPPSTTGGRSLSLSMKEWQQRTDFSNGTLERAMKRAVQNEESEVLIGTSKGQECYLAVDLPKKTEA